MDDLRFRRGLDLGIERGQRWKLQREKLATALAYAVLLLFGLAAGWTLRSAWAALDAHDPTLAIAVALLAALIWRRRSEVRDA